MSYGFEGFGGGFADPLVDGNGNLIIPAVQSPNFNLAAKTGWAIMQNGDAYFFNVVATGDVTAQSVVVEGATGGVFVYSGVPASGNLLASVTGSAGNDAFGNSYPQGFMVSNGTESIVLGENGGSPLIYFPTGRSGITNSNAIQVITMGSGATGYEQIQILGAEDSTELDSVLSTWLSSSHDGSQQPQIQHYYHDPTGTYHLLGLLSLAGFSITGNLQSGEPGTGTSRTNVVVPEVWHTLTLGTGFTVNGTDQAPRYRYEAINGGQVRLDGTVVTSAAVASGATIATIGSSAYWPTHRKRFSGLSNFSGNTVGSMVAGVSTTGVITTGSAANASGQQIVLDGITYPVD